MSSTPGTPVSPGRTRAPRSTCGRRTGAAPPCRGPPARWRRPGSPRAAEPPQCMGSRAYSRSSHGLLAEEPDLLRVDPQLLLEQPPPSVDPGKDRAQRCVEKPGDLLSGESVHVAEHQRAPVDLRQPHAHDSNVIFVEGLKEVVMQRVGIAERVLVDPRPVERVLLHLVPGELL